MQFVKTLNYMTAVAEVYKLNKPIRYNDDNPELTTKYVVVSSAICFGVYETLIFPADEDGQELGSTEIIGYRGPNSRSLCHEYLRAVESEHVCG